MGIGLTHIMYECVIVYTCVSLCMCERRYYTHYVYISSIGLIYIIQIMNGYECNGTDIFMRLEMECSIQRGKASI